MSWRNTVLIYQEKRHSSYTDARFQSRAGRQQTVPLRAKAGELNSISLGLMFFFFNQPRTNFRIEWYSNFVLKLLWINVYSGDSEYDNTRLLRQQRPSVEYVFEPSGR